MKKIRARFKEDGVVIAKHRTEGGLVFYTAAWSTREVIAVKLDRLAGMIEHMISAPAGQFLR